MICSISKYFWMLFLLTGCGSGLFNNDEKKDDDADDLIFSTTYDPADFYSFLDTCDRDMQKGGKKTTYNYKGDIIREEVCVYDASTKVLNQTSKRKDGDQLKESSYSETGFNDAGRIVSYKEWDDSSKAQLTQESTFTYNADGKLATSLEKRNDGNDTTTTTYSDDETPVQKTEVTTSGSTSTTIVTTCIGTLFFNYVACEETKDGKLTEKLAKEGEEFVRTELVKDALVETERFTLLDGALGHYAKYTRKSYDSSTGELESEELGQCTADGNKLTCTEKYTSNKGEEFYTYNSVFENFGKVRFTVGSQVNEYVAFIETSGNFKLLTDVSELSGSMTAVADPATLNQETKISLQKKPATHADLDSYFYSSPYWTHTSGSIEEIFESSVTDATVNFTSSVNFDSQKRETSSETKDLTGLTDEQINASFPWREVSTYD